MGFPHAYVPCERQARRAGKSKWTLAKKIKLFIDSILSFSYVPIRLMSLLGLLMAAGGFLRFGCCCRQTDGLGSCRNRLCRVDDGPPCWPGNHPADAGHSGRVPVANL